MDRISDEINDLRAGSVELKLSERESVRAKLRLMVKRILHKYKYPPDLLEGAVDLVLQQAQVIGESWG